ncbi:MAG: acyl-CoA dehydrogenase family protein, partial [Sciscionella sp.]
VRHACWVAETAPEELALPAATVAALLGPSYFQVAAQSIQLHGGIGFTWEHDAHLYYKRAKSDENLLGDSGFRLNQVADRLGIR